MCFIYVQSNDKFIIKLKLCWTYIKLIEIVRIVISYKKNHNHIGRSFIIIIKSATIIILSKLELGAILIGHDFGGTPLDTYGVGHADAP